MKNGRFLRVVAFTALVFVGIAAATFLFSAAYDAGVFSVAAERASRPPVSSGVQSDAPRGSSSVSAASQTSAAAAAAALQEHDLVLVNADNPLPSWYQPNLTDAFGIKLDRSALKPYTEMKTDASKDGVTLWISSAYRDGALQSTLFQREVEECSKTYPTYSEAVAAAARSVAKPGYSEHETGLALDLNGVEDDFDQTAAFRWLNSHAQDYGFILRYPKDKQDVTGIKYEPWHYRYVGVENAKAMKEASLCLEEYAARKAGSAR